MFSAIIHRFMEYMGRYRIILDRRSAEPYLERYYLFLRERKNFPFNIFIHHFLKSDEDVLHNHPWPFFTLILCGGYWEHLDKDKCVWRGGGSFRIMPRDTFHRIELVPGLETWTLFIPGPASQDWGFLTPRGWINHEHYLAKHSGGPSPRDGVI